MPEGFQNELSGEIKILNPDVALTSQGLPGDLGNAAYSILYEYDSLEMTKDETSFKEALRHARTFDDYYKERIRQYNEKQHQGKLYDEEESIKAQRLVCNQEAITAFDAKVMELRDMADDVSIDIKKIEKIIMDDIKLIIYGNT